MKRTFIAIRFPLPVMFERLYRGLTLHLENEPVKWVPIENFHITLHFLGNTSESMESKVIDLMDREMLPFPVFTVNICGFGGFPNLNRPKVLWFGLQYGNILNRLQQKLGSELGNRGFELDKRKFNPHLTIARVKGPLNKNLILLWESYADIASPDIQIDRVIYYESILKGKGPVYQSIHEVKLSGR